MYVEGMLPEVVRLHTRAAYIAAWLFPLADNFLCSHFMHRVDVTGDRSLVVRELYPTSNPSAPYLRGTLRGRGRILRTEPSATARLGWGWRRSCLRSHECNGGIGGGGGGGGWPLEAVMGPTDVGQMRILGPNGGEADANLGTLSKVLPSEMERTIEGHLRTCELILHQGIK